MMNKINSKFKEVISKEGMVSIVTWANGEVHIANTWNSSTVVSEDGRILIPAAGMQKTQENISINNKIKISIASKEVIGNNNYQGCGFLIEGEAQFLNSGKDFDFMLDKYPFLSRVLEVKVIELTQKI